MKVKTEGCEPHQRSLHIYVDYIVTGQLMADYAAVEDHLAGCSECAAAYADLLGMVLTDEIDRILDIALDADPASDRLLLNDALSKAGIDVELTLELAQHWLGSCRSELVRDNRGVASALSTIGILLEKKGEFEPAVEHHNAALVLAEQVGNDYSKARSLSSLGHIETLRSNLKAALPHLRAALELERELKDEFAQVRSLLALGDALAKCGNVASSLAAMRCYVQSRQVAEGIGYALGRISAESRVGQHTAGLADSLQGLIKGFVAKHVRTELSLLTRFCQDFTRQLTDALGGQRVLGPQLVPTRLAFGSADVKTPAILSAVVAAFQDLASPEMEEIPAGEEAIALEARLDSLKACLAQNDTRQHLTAIARRQGLSGKEAREFAEYFTKLLVDQPEQFVESFTNLP